MAYTYNSSTRILEYASSHTFAISNGDLYFAPEGTHSLVIDISGNTGTLDGFKINNGGDYLRFINSGTDYLSISGVVRTFIVDASGVMSLDGQTVNLNGSSSCTFGDDVGSIRISSNGDLSTTGLVLCAISSSDEMSLSTTAATAIGDDTSGITIETGMIDIASSTGDTGSIEITAGDNDSGTGDGGSITLQSGETAGGTAGSINLYSPGFVSANGTSGISLDTKSDMTFKDGYLSSSISLSESGTTGLSGYLSTSIVGALNEVMSSTHFETTIGATGAQYTTLKAAIDAGHTHILAVDDTTETASIAVPSGGFFLHIPRDIEVAMGNYSFTYTAAADVTYFGEGTLSWQHATNDNQLHENESYPASLTTVWGLHLVNSSGANSTFFSSANERIIDVTLTVGTGNIGGIEVADGCHGFYSNVEIIGVAGATIPLTTTGTGTMQASGIKFSGVWSTDATLLGISQFSYATLTNIYVDTVTTVKLQLRGEVELANLFSASGICNLTLIAGGSGAWDQTITNINLNGGAIDVEDADRISITNGQGIASIDMTDTGCTNLLLENLRITSAITLNGDRCRFNNCDLLGGITVGSTAAHTTISACQVGPDTSDSSTTITDNSTGSNTIIVACRTCASIAGTGTPVASANVVY